MLLDRSQLLGRNVDFADEQALDLTSSTRRQCSRPCRFSYMLLDRFPPLSKCCIQECHAIETSGKLVCSTKTKVSSLAMSRLERKLRENSSLKLRVWSKIRAVSGQAPDLHNLVIHLLTPDRCRARLSQLGGASQQHRLLLVICVALPGPPAPSPAAASPLLANLGRPATWRLQVTALPFEQPFA
jgi:hypothetical protein